MTDSLRISILSDDKALPGFTPEHGFAVLVERQGRSVLFDTGASPLLMQHVRQLGLDLSNLDAVVLSHGHQDHTGGLDAVIPKIGAAVPIVGLPGAERARYHGRREIGFRGGSEAHRRLVLIREPRQVARGIWATGPVRRRYTIEKTNGQFSLDPNGKTPDHLVDEQALLIETDGAPIVVLGCAHSGLINTLDTVAAWRKCTAFTAVLGGMHINGHDAERLDWTAGALRQYRIAHLGPCHCTGDAAAKRLRQLSLHSPLDCRCGSQLRWKRPSFARANDGILCAGR